MGNNGGIMERAGTKTNASRASNLDASGMRIVRKGCVVRFRGSGSSGEAAQARVCKVRMGHFWTYFGGMQFKCSDVAVVA